MSKECQICAEAVSKYKCPQCSIKYCSVLCYKQHKDKCKVKDGPKEPPRPDATSRLQESNDLEEGELSDSEMDGITADKVDKEMLLKLGESKDLKLLLGNPHLRVMMTALAEAEDPGKLMDEAMKEPIFTELADECLKIIEPATDHR